MYKRLLNTAPREYLLIYLLIAILLIIAAGYALINHFTYQYIGIYYFPMQWLIVAPLMLFLNLLAIYAGKTNPRLSFITWSYSTYYFVYLAIGLFVAAIQYTPFSIIDHYLIMADRLLHINFDKILVFTHSNKWLLNSLKLFYNSIVAQLCLMPILLPFFKRQQQAVYIFFAANLIAFMLGGSFYYFFPSVAPAHFFQSNLFSVNQHNTYLKFYNIHHYLPITNPAGGMIAFPSFHVFWAALIIYCYKNIKVVFYPLLCINMIAMSSTVLLGWHYFVDVPAGLLLAYVAIFIAKKLLNKISIYNSM